MVCFGHTHPTSSPELLPDHPVVRPHCVILFNNPLPAVSIPDFVEEECSSSLLF